MKLIGYLAILAVALVFTACEKTPTDPDPEPPAPEAMIFKAGARYEYTSYNTAAETGAKVDESERTRTLSLVNANASAHGQSGVAVYVDSVFNAGVFGSVSDTIYLRQDATGNKVYRYASIAPELDLNSVAMFDLGKAWMHEATAGATAGGWAVAEISDTVDESFGVSLIQGVKVVANDSVITSDVENVTIDGQEYKATKTTHRIKLSVIVLVTAGLFTSPIELKSETLNRVTWIVPALGAIVREERENKLISASYSGTDFSIPIPGYVSVMTAVLATGN